MVPSSPGPVRESRGYSTQHCFGEEADVMNPDLARNLVACVIGAHYLVASRLSSKSMGASQMSTLRAGFVVEALPLESLPTEPDKTASDSSRPKRRRMYSLSVNSTRIRRNRRHGK